MGRRAEPAVFDTAWIRRQDRSQPKALRLFSGGSKVGARPHRPVETSPNRSSGLAPSFGQKRSSGSAARRDRLPREALVRFDRAGTSPRVALQARGEDVRCSRCSSIAGTWSATPVASVRAGKAAAPLSAETGGARPLGRDSRRGANGGAWIDESGDVQRSRVWADGPGLDHEPAGVLAAPGGFRFAGRSLRAVAVGHRV